MIDKSTIQQVLGGLIKHPQYLSQSDKYQFQITDFSNRFEKMIFVAIHNLYQNGARNIQPIDIENYFEVDKASKVFFDQNNGIQYLQDIEDLVDESNFDYYYHKLKKINLLRDYKLKGIDISEFYEEDLTKPRAIEINKDFELLTIQQITKKIKEKILLIESHYLKNDVTEVENAAEGIDDLIASFDVQADVGLPIQGVIINEILSGARRGTLCIRSMASGVGKTRQAVGDACYLAYPIRYNSETCEWEKTGSSEKVLFIATEQNFDEIRKMIIAYLSDINESKFRYGDFSDRERKVLAQTIQLMKEYEDNFKIVRMPNPQIELVKHIVRENCLLYNINYVFYDYIFIGPALLNEYRGFNLRNDELLLMFATALKDLAVELDIFVMTSTQVNANVDDNKNIRNESSLAGGRSTINKADYGLVASRPTREELEALEPIRNNYGTPNVVTDIFKVRSGRWTQVRVWSDVNLGTMKKKDLFITDSSLNAIDDFVVDFNYVMHKLKPEEEEKAERILHELQRDS